MADKKPHLRDFAANARRRTNKHRLYRIGYELAAWGTPVLVIATLYSLYRLQIIPQFLAVLLALTLIGFRRLFIRFRKKAKRYAIDTARLIENDQRQPFLYLRSFEHDARTTDRQDYFTKRTELKLTSALNQVGPVIAVGRPGEELPSLGASRIYFANEEWQDRVKELMQISRLVIIHPDNSEGLEWEMRTARQSLAPERLVFVLASWHTLKRYGQQIEYDVLRSKLKHLFKVSLPDEFNGAYFLYFAEDWTPKFSQPPWYKKWVLKKQSVNALRGALNPIFHNAARLSAENTENVAATARLRTRRMSNSSK